MEPLRLGLLGGQFYEGLPKGARLMIDRDTWLREIFTGVDHQQIGSNEPDGRRIIRLVQTGKMVEVLAGEPRSMLNCYNQPI